MTADDALAKKALAESDIDVVGIPWDQNGIDWTVQFLAWMETLYSKGVNLINDYTILRWNAEKTYLRDLLAAGVTVVPTVYALQGCNISIVDILEQQAWQRAAIKPTISGTSLHTWVSSPATIDYDQRRLEGLLEERNMMLQKYLPEIETEGEISMIYFDGKFSHAVRKMPKLGDFRVQSDFGGTWTAVSPDDDILRRGREILRASGHDSVYARIDGVVHEGAFLLMELEMIEPHLFLESDEAAPDRFAHAIRKRLRHRKTGSKRLDDLAPIAANESAKD